MTFRIDLYALSLALLLGSACNPSTSSSTSVVSSLPKVRLELETSNEFDEPDTRQPFGITRTGKLTFGGAKIAGERIASAFKKLRAGGKSKATIEIHQEAAHFDIVTQLAEVGGEGRFELPDVKRHEKFTKPSAAEEQSENGPAFRGAFGPLELPVAVGLASDGKACLATLNGKTVGYKELNDQSFLWLDTLVRQAGGAATFFGKPEDGRNIVARIQSAPETPWRCVAGAIYAVQIAGWPFAELEVTGK